MSQINNDEVVNPVAFIETLQTEITAIGTCVSKEQFAEKFEDFNFSKEVIETLHETLNDKIRKDTKKKINAIFNDEEVEAVYEACCEIRKKGIKIQGKAWRPPGNVKDHMRSLYIDLYNRDNEQLKLKLAEMKQQNKIISEQIEEKEKKFRLIDESVSEFMRESAASISQITENNHLAEQFWNNCCPQMNPEVSSLLLHDTEQAYFNGEFKVSGASH